ncbi:MAG TPA: class I SAM-dependent methyltransferase [Thermoanaerobaculia bacterium]|nr:class I SAM-dependent methyltransferase [Thermoanaerobaculia bacterium]
MSKTPEQAEIAERIASRFTSRWLRGYVRSKLARDPVYAAVYERLRDSPLPLLDIGCGIGLLAFYLRERGFEPPIAGIDMDDAKIKLARDAAEGRYAGLRFEQGDAREPQDGFRGNVALLDVVHYHDGIEQQRLLTNAERHAIPGAIVILRECPRDGSLRYRATYAEEWFATAIGWLRVPMLNFPTLDEVASVFRAKGYREEIRPLWGRTPFNNHLFVFKAPEQSDPAPSVHPVSG